MTPEIDPYPGLAPFRDRIEDRKLFSGRNYEKDCLLALVLAERLALLFGRSGVGKTSLIQAGLLEPLRDHGFFPVVARLTYDLERGPVRSIFAAARAEADRQAVTIAGGDDKSTLWEWFRTAVFSQGMKRLRPVIVLDQFEELFTTVRIHSGFEEEFMRQFSDLVRGRVPADIAAAAVKQIDTLAEDRPERRELVALLYENTAPDVKVLASIREDYLPELETLRTLVPSIFQHSLRLEPLTIEQARDAIVNPGKQKEVLHESFTVSDAAVKEILAFLRTRRVGNKLIEGPTIEPVQLQILCRHLNEERRRRKATEITVDLLKGRRGMENAIRGHYLKVVDQFARFRLGWNARRFKPSLTNWLVLSRPRAAVAALCGRGLITASGHRNSLPQVIVQRTFGVPVADLGALVSSRILSVEARLGSQFYELIHDTLLAPVKQVERRRRMRRRGAALAVLAIVALTGIPAYQWYEHRRTLKALASAEDQGQVLRAQMENGARNFANAPLDGIEASGVQASRANFAGAGLNYAHLERAYLAESLFIGARLLGADIREATLFGASFTGADLTNAILTDADLRNADFTDANLENALLAGADVEGAKFARAKITMLTADGKNTFEGVPWWLASGWTDTQVNELLLASSPNDLMKTKAFRDAKKRLDAAAARAPNREIRAEQLHYRARFLSVRGVMLGTALEDVVEALHLKPNTGPFLRTHGYVLLQLMRCSEAEGVLMQALGGDGQAEYHLALAKGCSAAADPEGSKSLQQESRQWLERSRSLGYLPTYERVRP